MKHEFTAIIERDGEWFIAYSPEIPGANGQGKTKDEARQNLAEAIDLILEDRREDEIDREQRIGASAGERAAVGHHRPLPIALGP